MAMGNDKRSDFGKSDGRSDGGIVRHFVNHLEVSLSLTEFQFGLAAVSGGETPGGSLSGSGRPGPATWLFTTAPDHMVIMHRRLGQALDSYRTRFAPIAAPPAETGDGPESGSDG